MNGHVLAGTPIAVDLWRLSAIKKFKARVFFLSHAHCDHVAGLTSTWKNIIYTSAITAKIIIHKLEIPSHLVKVLEFKTTHLIPLDPDGKENVAVTLLDANHCPGSVMFIFQGYFGTILYTGDFCYDFKMISEIKHFCPEGVDELYLDNTYCDPSYNFRSREEILFEILKFVAEHEKDYNVVFGLRNLGKEELLLVMARHFKRYIAVEVERYQLLKQLQMPNVFTTDDSITNFRVVPFHKVTRGNIIKWNNEYPTAVVLPTALYVNLGIHPFSDDPHVLVVPYSDHSSFVKIDEFVKEINPGLIHPIVPNCKAGHLNGINRSDMTLFDKYLRKDKRPSTIPDSIRQMTATTYLQNVTKLPPLLTTKYPSAGKKKGVVFNELSPEKSVNSHGQNVCEDDIEISIVDSEDDADVQEIVTEEAKSNYLSRNDSVTATDTGETENCRSNIHDSTNKGIPARNDNVTSNSPRYPFPSEKEKSKNNNKCQSITGSPTSQKEKRNNTDGYDFDRYIPTSDFKFNSVSPMSLAAESDSFHSACSNDSYPVPRIERILSTEEAAEEFFSNALVNSPKRLLSSKSPCYCEDFNEVIAANPIPDTQEELLEKSNSDIISESNSYFILSQSLDTTSSKVSPSSASSIFLGNRKTSSDFVKLGSQQDEFVIVDDNSNDETGFCNLKTGEFEFSDSDSIEVDAMECFTYTDVDNRPVPPTNVKLRESVEDTGEVVPMNAEKNFENDTRMVNRLTKRSSDFELPRRDKKSKFADFTSESGTLTTDKNNNSDSYACDIGKNDFKRVEMALSLCLHQSFVDQDGSSSDSDNSNNYRFFQVQWAAIRDIEERIFRLGRERRYQEAINLEILLKWQCQQMGIESLM